MITVDASALVIAVADTTVRGAGVRARLAETSAAPHLVDAEVGQALRGLVHRGVLDADDARRSLVAAQALVGDRFAHQALAARAWELRENVSFYDALYVAVAETLGTALFTADRRLASAVGIRCDVTVV